MTSTPRTFVGTTTFRVAGMSCSHCATAVAAEIHRVAGVTAVDVTVATGMVTVSAAGPVDRADISVAVTRAGHALVP